MKKAVGSFLVLLFCVWCAPVFAEDQSTEIEQLKQEVNKLLQRIEQLEKKQTVTETKKSRQKRSFLKLRQRQ